MQVSGGVKNYTYRGPVKNFDIYNLDVAHVFSFFNVHSLHLGKVKFYKVSVHKVTN